MPIDTRNLAETILGRPRWQKLIVAPIADISLCVLSFWLALCTRLEAVVSLQSIHWLVALVTGGILACLFFGFGQYKAVFRYIGLQALGEMVRLIVLVSVFLFAVLTFIRIPEVPRSLGVIFPLYLVILLPALRLAARGFFVWSSRFQRDAQKNVLIYGAGDAGFKLQQNLAITNAENVVGFIDDNVKKRNSTANGIPIFGPDAIENLVKLRAVREIYLALPSISKARRRRIFEELRPHKLRVRTLSHTHDMAQLQNMHDSLRDLSIEDITGRDFLTPDLDLEASRIQGRTVLVTGAGGSIGSVLCKQLMYNKPSRLLLVENSEHNLFKIQEDLKQNFPGEDMPKLEFHLGDVRDKTQLDRIFSRSKVDIVFHAAAYKHVGLVESNLFAGLKNNIFGTLNVVRAASKAKVESFILISTDKAVRPSNIMGVSKRVTELIVAGHAGRRPKLFTKFAVVRFGNVFNSSGSVVPKFREQISRGGPVTVSHPHVKRYFMSIEEAAQLVVQACNISRGGEIFVLDMGKPIEIHELAEQMIWMSGLSVKDEANPDGDIEIKITNLGRGEKLEEELVYSRNSIGTDHPKILRDHEEMIDWTNLEPKLAELQEAMDLANEKDSLRLLSELVPSYVDNMVLAVDDTVVEPATSLSSNVIPISKPS